VLKVLVTGATGFLGSHVCRQLAEAGFQVTALCRPLSDTEPLAGISTAFRTACLTDAGSLTDAVKGHDAVIHAAANIRYASAPADLHHTNVEGTRTLARICREQKIARFVHVSSVSAIGIPCDRAVADEGFAFNLENSRLHYHLSKKRAEEAVLEEAARGLGAVVVNPASLFGPRGRFFRGGEMVYKIQRGSIIPYFLGGICAAHVDDVASGIVAALDHGKRGERYILGGENITYQEIARRGAAALGVKRHLVPVWPLVTRAAMLLRPARFSYTTHYTAARFQFYSSEKARRELGYEPRPFAGILAECLAFPERAQSAAASSGTPARVEP
jgi:dihydroflavonol-4-reductase